MAPEGSATTSSPSSSPAGASKRGRDPEDEVYVDNLHSHKRYLSEIMASSLNGLTVGDPLPETIMDSLGRSEGIPYLRDEISVQYSPMSEDSDDSRYYESSTNMCSSQPESAPTSPVSPYRYQKPPTPSYPSYLPPAMASSQPRQRGSDSEGRFPSSPSDICHSADLRRAALLRSVQMRAQPSQFDMPLEAATYIKHDVEGRGYGECVSISDSENEDKNIVVKLKGEEE